VEGAKEWNTFSACLISMLFEVKTTTIFVFITCRPNRQVLTRFFVYVFAFDFTNGPNTKY
jgi:hypothetical protein